MNEIAFVEGREVLDSRGYPTIEVEVMTEDGFFGRAIAPSGASTGAAEAHELRDNDPNRYGGKGVLRAVKNIKEKIAPHILDLNVFEQTMIDQKLIDLDGSEQKSHLGANTILAVSLACAKAAANVLSQPLYRYLGGVNAKRLPVPMMNIINGGAHADNNIDFQEFMIVPHGFSCFSEALRAGAEIFHHLKKILQKHHFITSVGDEGGFAPNLKSNSEALDLIIEAIQSANYQLDTQISIALDVAASSFYKDSRYHLSGENQILTTEELVEKLISLCDKYPIVSIEDGLDEEDWEGFQSLTSRIGNKVQIVGDDLFVTNCKRLARGIKEKSANAILIKLNQIGTLTETLDAIEMAKKAGFRSVISHRSGETEDHTIADLAVAMNCGQIKTGSLSRTDRICKYNQLLRIEQELSTEGIHYQYGWE